MISGMARTSIDELREATERAPDETVEAIYKVGTAICERLNEIILTGGVDVSGDVHAIRTLLAALERRGGSDF
jgi:hypothetical protein